MNRPLQIHLIQRLVQRFFVLKLHAPLGLSCDNIIAEILPADVLRFQRGDAPRNRPAWSTKARVTDAPEVRMFRPFWNHEGIHLARQQSGFQVCVRTTRLKDLEYP